MTSMIAEPVILKTDGLGRVRTPAAQREALLDAFERSGLSGMKFAALHGVKYPSFANWVQRRKRQRLQGHAGPAGASGTPPDLDPATAGSTSPLHWLEAVVAGGASGAPPGPGALRLHLPGGVRMEITASDQVPWAARLIQSLTAEATSRTSNRQPVRSC